MERKLVMSAIAIVIGTLLAPHGYADDPVYGYQLMTEQERTEHRVKMQSFQTEEERETYRREHHKMMQERAKAQGVTLPEEPMPRGQGRGTGKGQGGGKGQGYRGGQGQAATTDTNGTK